MTKVAIVGGGPGGLMTAYLLEQKYKDSCQTTLFEASDRTGGKILTRHFDSVPVIYEAGVAEFYAYQMLGPDPLRQLIKKLGLKIVPMDGQTVVLAGKILRNHREIKKLCGEATLKALLDFRQRGAAAMPLEMWYEGYWQDDNKHPWAHRTCEAVLDDVPDETARKYLKVAAHSDLATEPHLTNGLNGLKNFLMDVDGYIKLYSVEGGIERLPLALRARLTRTSLELNSPVQRVEKNADGTYRVTFRRERQTESRDFDVVFIALPHNWLTSVEWGGESLRKAMSRHIAYFDRPAHYLRISLLFKQPFWRRLITDSWFMSDAFGGCCVYDEGARHDTQGYGVLGWLLAGTDALSLAGFSDQALIEKALDSLPDEFYQEARELFIEGKVHRWLASVNALPGGTPVREIRTNHLPEPKEHPGIFTVGDYVFDSTLNGVLDSADFATDLLQSWMLRQRLMGITLATHGHEYDIGIDDIDKDDNDPQSASASIRPAEAPSFPKQRWDKKIQLEANYQNAAAILEKGKLDRAYFDDYDGVRSYENSYGDYFDAEYVAELIRIVWKSRPPYRLLDAGSANGLTLAQFSKSGIEAWGIEKNKYIHRQTPKEWKKRNLLGDLRKLPFPDNHFDFVYETCLSYLPESQLGRAIKELHRVSRRGVIFASVTSEMNPQLFKRSNMFWGLKTLMMLWEWNELFMAHGFKLEVSDRKTLARLWRCEEKYNDKAGDIRWYPEAESLRYCFYTKVNHDAD